MSQKFCHSCGKEIDSSAEFCPHCGASQNVAKTPPEIPELPNHIPDGVKGWSWGAFLLSWIWALGNRVWIGLIALIPYVGIIMAIILGFKGREWAWKAKQWESVEEFNRVQKKWSKWAVWIFVIVFGLGILAAISIPAYQDYVSRANLSAGLSSSDSSVLEDVSGVWRAHTDGAMVTIKLFGSSKYIDINGQKFNASIKGYDSDNHILTVVINDNPSLVWSIRENLLGNNRFDLTITLQDGTQDDLSFVRNLG